jgi:uncharacterized membrane protein
MIVLQMLMVGLLWFSAVGCGLLAGLYFAFSAFIMMALGRIGQTAGGVLHVLGMFVVTMVFNVPLNNALAAADPASQWQAGF